MVIWMLRVVFEDNPMSEIGRACLIELFMVSSSSLMGVCRSSRMGLFCLLSIDLLRDAACIAFSVFFFLSDTNRGSMVSRCLV